MKISERMTRDVQLVTQAQSIRDAAQLMAQLDVGALPVADSDRLVGMITDRDIAVRAVAAGQGPETPIRDAMSADVLYCYEDQTVEEVARNMADVRVRRLPVVNRDKRLVGIISLGDIATGAEPDEAGKALRGISSAGGQRSQSDSRASL
jgi:CBS domain-containing protein